MKILLSSFIFSLSAFGQGLPLIRNFTAAEYDGHNRNFDIEIDQDGTIFVANFEGLLYYDQAQWRIVRAPDFNRVTSIWRDSTNTVCVGGYQFKASVKDEYTEFTINFQRSRV
jgi:hypothetical protein